MNVAQVMSMYHIESLSLCFNVWPVDRRRITPTLSGGITVTHNGVTNHDKHSHAIPEWNEIMRPSSCKTKFSTREDSEHPSISSSTLIRVCLPTHARVNDELSMALLVVVRDTITICKGSLGFTPGHPIRVARLVKLLDASLCHAT